MNTIRKWALAVAALAAVFGGTLSVISTSQHLRIQSEGLLRESFCAINEKVNCDIVNASSYSEFMNVPIAWWGLVFYVVLLALSMFAVFSKKERRASIVIAWFMSAASLFYSAYLAYISFIVLDVLCIECVGMYLANILLFVFLFVSLRIGTVDMISYIKGYMKALIGKKSGLEFRTAIVPHAAVVAVFFLLGWAVISNVEAKYRPYKEDINADELVKYFNMQSLYDLKVEPSWTVWGNKDAPVKIVEFSEFQCPFCKMAAFLVRPLLQEYKDKIAYYFVNYPLDNSCNKDIEHAMHPNACLAARAGICADKMGDFWSFHDEVFRNQNKVGSDLIMNLVEKRGWNKDEFTSCMNSPETEERLQSDMEAARKMYVDATPTIFINGRKLKYWRSSDFVRKVVASEIKKTRTK